ncbi:Protein of unknown function [Luteibacter sp. 329MFSha]|nr:Protein of unknown function [Luteibacter sp. 329MFSha]
MRSQFVQRRARQLRWLTLAASTLLVLMLLGVSVVSDNSVIQVTGQALPRAWRLVASGVVIALAVLSLLSLATTLRAVEAGDPFGRSMTRSFRRFALLYLLSVVADLLLPPIMQLSLFVAHGGHGLITVGFDDGRVLALIVAALLFFIARLFDEARRLEDDNRGFV